MATQAIQTTSVLQLNMQHSKAATGNLAQLLQGKTSFVALIQEPYLVKGRVVGLHKVGCVMTGGSHDTNKGPRAAVVVSGDIQAWILPHLSDRDITSVRVEGGMRGKPLIMASVYMENAEGASCPPAKLKELAAYCEDKDLPLIVGADANAHHVYYGSTDTNESEELV